MQEPPRILTSREALYRRASAQVDTSHAPLEDSLKAVVHAIEVGRFIA